MPHSLDADSKLGKTFQRGIGIFIALALFPWIFCFPLLALDNSAGKDAGLNIGIMSSFFSGVNTADALAATKVWASAIVQKKGYAFTPQVAVFENTNAAVQAAKENRLDLLVSLSNEFWAIKNLVEMDPYFIASRHGRAEDEILLLAHRRSPIQKLDELEGKSILLSSVIGLSIGKIWLENLVMEKGFDSLDSFSRNTSITAKDSSAVLPVFFHKADACLIVSSGFDIITEMNPQLRNDLKIIVQSPPLVIAVISVRKSYGRDMKESLLDSLEDLHSDPKGQQILMLFKTERLVPFDKTYLTKVGQLIAEHERLEKQTKAR